MYEHPNVHTDVDIESGYVEQSVTRPHTEKRKSVTKKVGQAATSYVDGISRGAADVPQAAKEAVRRTWSSRGAWSIGAACFICGIPPVVGFIWNITVGGISGLVSNKPLPTNAPGEMRLGQSAVGFGRSVFMGVGTGIDQQVRVQLVGLEQPQTPSRIPYTSVAGYPTLPYQVK